MVKKIVRFNFTLYIHYNYYCIALINDMLILMYESQGANVLTYNVV